MGKCKSSEIAFQIPPVLDFVHFASNVGLPGGQGGRFAGPGRADPNVDGNFKVNINVKEYPVMTGTGIALTTAAVAAGSTIVRKPFGMRKEHALLVGLWGLTIAACFTSSKSLHVAAGVLFSGAMGYHVYKHRKGL